jgi:hypothetical protein
LLILLHSFFCIRRKTGASMRRCLYRISAEFWILKLWITASKKSCPLYKSFLV